MAAWRPNRTRHERPPLHPSARSLGQQGDPAETTDDDVSRRLDPRPAEKAARRPRNSEARMRRREVTDPAFGSSTQRKPRPAAPNWCSRSPCARAPGQACAAVLKPQHTISNGAWARSGGQEPIAQREEEPHTPEQDRRPLQRTARRSRRQDRMHHFQWRLGSHWRAGAYRSARGRIPYTRTGP
jgi:hypothetical protein